MGKCVWEAGFVTLEVSGGAVDSQVVSGSESVLLINACSYHAQDTANRKSHDVLQGFLDVLKANDDLKKKGVPRFSVVELDVLRSSVEQSHEDWLRLAHVIRENYDEYCGFVVRNGVSSMVATATALSFMLENLAKPVIFTGSCIQPERLYTDLQRNLIVALLFAKCSHICEVCILFDDKLLRANRAIRDSRSTLMPFSSPNFPPLATVQGTIRLHQSILLSKGSGSLHVMENMKTSVLCLKLGPSLPKRTVLKAIEITEARAIVILAYGSGNGPTHKNYMKQVVEKALQSGMIIVVCTQNLYGSVNLSTYEAGEQLLKAGALSACDMTFDAVVMKLKYLFGLGLSNRDVSKTFSDVNLRGEVSLRPFKL